MSESVCLHCEINEVGRAHVDRTKEEVNLAELVAKVTESLVDLILLGPEEDWGNLLAEANTQLGQAFLEKSGAAGEGTETAH
jgi:hypothetical protein